MVVLNLRDDCVARTATNFRRGMTDKRFLELEITAWLASPERKRQLTAEVYYDGQQDVLKRRRMALDDDGKPMELTHLPNNRLVNNLYSKMVDQKTNYSFGRPFSLDTERKDYAAALATVLGARFRRTMRTVGEGAWIGGKAWLYPYYEGGALAFKRFPADEVLPFWADADHTILDAAVHIYVVEEYDESEQAKAVVKVEVMHGGGVDCFIRRDDGTLEPDPDGHSGDYITAEDPDTGKEQGYNWDRIPLVCFKSSHHEIPLLSRVKCLQDAYNDILSTFANQMEEDVHNTVLVIKNAEGEDLGKFRKNLAIYGAVKVRSYEGSEGGVDTLTIEVNAENYKVLLALLKDAIIENARGYDAKDERINNANEPEISLAWDGLDRVMANQFLDDADEQGVSVWEQELKIRPKDTDTLAVRKARVKAMWNRELPYTVPWLKNWLQGLCGPQGYEVAIVDYSIHIQLDYTILPDAALIAEQILDLLLAVRPSNMWVLMVSFVQSEGTVQMGAMTERSVYMDVWPMLVNELESAGGVKMAGPLEYHATVEIYPYKEDQENA